MEKVIKPKGIIKISNTINLDLTKWRACLDDKRGWGNCPFMAFNEYGTACCTIDKIVQVEFYGCIPQEILDKKYDS